MRASSKSRAVDILKINSIVERRILDFRSSATWRTIRSDLAVEICLLNQTVSHREWRGSFCLSTVPSISAGNRHRMTSRMSETFWLFALLALAEESCPVIALVSHNESSSCVNTETLLRRPTVLSQWPQASLCNPSALCTLYDDILGL